MSYPQRRGRRPCRAEPSHAGDGKRQRDPDRPGEIRRRSIRGLFHCQTGLVDTFRELDPAKLRFGGNRCIPLDAKDELPRAALRHCVALALTYHLNKRKAAR
jgi:hypothetical protein